MGLARGPLHFPAHSHVPEVLPSLRILPSMRTPYHSHSKQTPRPSPGWWQEKAGRPTCCGLTNLLYSKPLLHMWLLLSSLWLSTAPLSLPLPPPNSSGAIQNTGFFRNTVFTTASLCYPSFPTLSHLYIFFQILSLTIVAFLGSFFLLYTP